jgi:hypothetical protein
MQVDSQFVGEDDFDDISDRRSPTSHQNPSKGFGQEPKTQSSKLGKSLFAVRRKHRKTKMVGRVLGTEKWVAHTTSFGKGAKNIDPRRRFRHGVGVSSPEMQTSGYWQEPEKERSINVRELKTIYSRGQNWCTKLKINIASPPYVCDFCGIYHLKGSLNYTLCYVNRNCAEHPSGIRSFLVIF